MPTDFTQIRYDDPSHAYSIGDVQLTSVTSVLKCLYPIFERDKISRRSATKQNRTVESILAEWDNNSKIALQKGTIVHAYAEDLFVGRVDPIMRSLSGVLPEVIGMDKIWATLQKQNAFLIEKEKVVGDEELGIAGRIDALLSIKGEKHIFDWKTGKFDIKNGFGGKLCPPFNDLDDSKLNRYSLQTSLYRLIIERNTGEQYGDGYIGHLPKMGVPMLYRCFDFRERLQDWLLSGSWRYDKDADDKASQIVEILARITSEFVNKISDPTRNSLLNMLDQSLRITTANEEADIDE